MRCDESWAAEAATKADRRARRRPAAHGHSQADPPLPPDLPLWPEPEAPAAPRRNTTYLGFSEPAAEEHDPNPDFGQRLKELDHPDDQSDNYGQ